MIKRISGQISIRWISIVLDYSLLLLINRREREIKICTATCKICRESGAGSWVYGEKKACGDIRKWNDKEISTMFDITGNQGCAIPLPVNWQKTINHKQTCWHVWSSGSSHSFQLHPLGEHFDAIRKGEGVHTLWAEITLLGMHHA